MDTFSNLKQAVRDWANHRHITDAKAADFIRTAEKRAARVLRVEELEKTTTDYNTGSGVRDWLVEASNWSVTLPADYLDLKDIWSYAAVAPTAPPPDWEYGAVNPSIRRISLEMMNAKLAEPLYEWATYPLYFARDNRLLWLFPIITRNFVRMTYYAQPPFLSATNPTNALLEATAEGLLYAALAEASLFLKQPEQAAQFDARFVSEMDTVQRRSDRAALSGGSVIQRSPMYG